jgi:dehydrogenase/reductase SDR family protein 13
MSASTIPDQQGRTVVITGANTGIGRVTAEVLAAAGARVVLACRSRERTEGVLAAIAAIPGAPAPVFVPLDLSSLADVRRAADALREACPRIDVLVNNAGLAGARGQTRDGFELAFGTNHLGHFLLTHLLRPALEAAPAPRVVNVASEAHYRSKGIPLDGVQQPTRTRTGFAEYADSKLANVLFTAELHRRWKASPILAASLHPGVVATEVWRQLPGPLAWVAKRFMITAEEGARTTLHCATHAEVAEHPGAYWDQCRVRKASRIARSEDAAAALWDRSLGWCGLAD